MKKGKWQKVDGNLHIHDEVLRHIDFYGRYYYLTPIAGGKYFIYESVDYYGDSNRIEFKCTKDGIIIGVRWW